MSHSLLAKHIVLGFLLLWGDTMTMAALIRKTCNGGGANSLTVSEVQFISSNGEHGDMLEK